ncbi:Alpha/beta hydrolase family protein [Botrimarina colliarenosi]|uniref:Alpha/beta hydrolase family protein n=2 Tax=Botrimarina colliarenosi TaxID=2528001 RepID=A0A5C6ALF2_9BACT|nr:Alpha/beta hydrolase family protein [Botrimarina colliarenosi]
MIVPAEPLPAEPSPEWRAAATRSRELVVLTHGIGSTRLFLAPLAARLHAAGFAVRLYGYPSPWWSNATFGKRFAALLRRVAPGYERVHLVVHSMGGIVTRCALREELPPNLGRVVQIAPPNRGSHMATRLAVDSGHPVWDRLVVRPHRFLAPTLVELIDAPDSFVNRLGPVPPGIELGILAASRDRVLYPEQTHLEGARDHQTVEGWHTGILWKRETAELVARFLRTGAFYPQ